MSVVLGNIDEELVCPVCGSTYLHHSAVVYCHRAKEDAPTRVITLDDGVVVNNMIDVGDTMNPSSRRDGMYIEFWCENCHGDYDDRPKYLLALFQHKGQTYLRWDLP